MSPIKRAIEHIKNHNIADARLVLQLHGTLSDSEVTRGLITLDKGLNLLLKQDTSASLQPLKDSYQILCKSDDENIKSFIQNLIMSIEGIEKLFNGDTENATTLLNNSSEAWEKMSFYLPEFELNALSMKATFYIAKSKTFINTGDISSAEIALGQCRGVHEKLLKKLDRNIEEHITSFVEVYGTRIEFALMHITSFALPTLDIDLMRNQISGISEDIRLVKEILPNTPDGEIKYIVESYLLLTKALETLGETLEIIIFKRRAFKLYEVEKLIKVEETIFIARQTALKSGLRSRGVILACDQLSRLQTNLLRAGKSVTKDFGRFSGLISLMSFVIVFTSIQLTLEPVGMAALQYFTGTVIFSLIVGFGYGALKFMPLMTLFKKALSESREK